jgi:flagellar biosynthesis protein FlhF
VAVEQFIEQGESYSECVQKIRMKYGDSARILNHRTISIKKFFGLFATPGVEVSGYISSESMRAAARSMTGGSGYVGGSAAPSAQPSPEPLDFEAKKQKFLADVTKTDPTVQIILKEVRDIKEKMESVSAGGGPAEEHASLTRIEELMYQNDFSSAYTKSILERIKKEFTLDSLDDFDAVQNKVVEWIGESVKIQGEPKNPRRPRIMVLVGPTGVGKTTTIAKLAAAYGVNGWSGSPLEVRMITIDGYRIAARQQLEIYGEIMGIPVSFVNTNDELRKAIVRHSTEADLVLVDTIGKSPRDAVKLAEMKQFLNACGSSAEVHLAVSASTKYSDIREILQQFAPFNYQSLAITKLDETVRVGNVISALSEQGKAVSFITDGQSVDKHLHRASVVRFLINLEGFSIVRDEIEKKFSTDGDR